MTRAVIASLCLLLWSAPAAAQATNRSVTINDVIQLAQSGISDETIITFLDTREIGFGPSAQDIVRLRAAGVSDEVIRYLLQRTAAVPAPVYPPPVAYSPGYGVPSYPLAYYTPGYYAAGAVFSVGFPIVPHWLHEHHVSHVAVGHVFAAGGVHVITGHADAHRGGPSFAAPLHPSGGGHGITRVDFAPLSPGHITGAGYIGAAHGASVHSVAIVPPASGAIHAAGGVSHGTANDGGGHAAGHGGGHAAGHGGGHSGGHGGR